MYQTNPVKTFSFNTLMQRVLLLVTIVLSLFSHGQEIDKAETLFYLSSKGKVFLEPDYSSVALYLAGEMTNKNMEAMEYQARQLAKNEQKISIKDKDISLLNKRGMLKFGIEEGKIQSIIDTQSLLKSASLESIGDYEVIPSYRINDRQIWLTKQVAVKLKDQYTLTDIEPILDLSLIHI